MPAAAKEMTFSSASSEMTSAIATITAGSTAATVSATGGTWRAGEKRESAPEAKTMWSRA